MEPALSNDLIAYFRRNSTPLVPIPTGVQPHLAGLRNIRAVLFDVYGTLLISGVGDVGTTAGAIRARALREALDECEFGSSTSATLERGVELWVQTVQSDHALARGNGVDCPEVDVRTLWMRVLRQLRDEHLLAGKFDEAAVTRLAAVYECHVNPVWPMPGLHSVLAALRDKGLLLGIVSNAQFFTTLIFQALLDGNPSELGFRHDLCAWSFEHRVAKPSLLLPGLVVKRLKELHGITPAETLFVGNHGANDIAPAAALGLRTALFAGDTRSYKPASSGSPDLIITELSQLPPSLA